MNCKSTYGILGQKTDMKKFLWNSILMLQYHVAVQVMITKARLETVVKLCFNVSLKKEIVIEKWIIHELTIEKQIIETHTWK